MFTMTLTIPSAVSVTEAARTRLLDPEARFFSVDIFDGPTILSATVEAQTRAEALGIVLLDVMNEDGAMSLDVKGAVVTEVRPSTYDEIEEWLLA